MKVNRIVPLSGLVSSAPLAEVELIADSAAFLVQRVEDGECIADNITASDDPENDPPEQKVEVLVEMICQDDDHGTRAAALLVLLAAVANADDPKSLANTAKHCAFTRCGEMNVYGMVDVQIAMLERELFTHNSRLS